mmetsp:Transcript_21927/g.30823  ORF Transcript_21927/g.30823 Transcript_21927/m.30823 type:complete len:140 (-) Transcript_21927:380-799(-)
MDWAYSYASLEHPSYPTGSVMPNSNISSHVPSTPSHSSPYTSVPPSTIPSSPSPPHDTSSVYSTCAPSTFSSQDPTHPSSSSPSTIRPSVPTSCCHSYGHAAYSASSWRPYTSIPLSNENSPWPCTSAWDGRPCSVFPT